MKKTILTFISGIAIAWLLIALHNTEFTLITKFADCQFSAIPEKCSDDSMSVYMPFHNTKTRKVIVPLIYDKITFQKPFYASVTLVGKVEKLEAVTLIFREDEKEIFTLPVDVTQMNKNTNKNQKGENIFSSKKYKLPFSCITTDKLGAIILVKTIDKNNKTNTHSHPIKINRTYTSEIGNKLLFDIMSV